ncbi:MAG TPA: acyltransferase [Burkholderiaceae bacterium]|jgi:peptidoglycan/LPS O-acetylase OafA/YrhL
MTSKLMAAGSAVASVTRPESRMAFLDSLKACLAILVVFHHAGQPYGPTGGSWPVMHTEKFRLLGPFFHTNASFFMGLFFLISAYFLPMAFARKGAKTFLFDRFRRLGLPVLGFGIFLFPAFYHFLGGKPWSESFLPFEWAHLWFLGHLMVYASIYTAYRMWRGDTSNAVRQNNAGMPFPGNGALLAYAVLLALVDMVVRAWYPVDVWSRFIVTAELGHLPQYASLFLFGLLASSQHWMEKIPARTGRIWLGVAMFATLARFAYTLAHAGFLSVDTWWADLAWNLWESMICVSMCVGLPYWFSRHARDAGTFARFAGRNAFSLYVLHLPVLVMIQMALEHSAFGPFTLTLLSGAFTVAACYGIALIYSLIKTRPSRAAKPAVATIQMQ